MTRRSVFAASANFESLSKRRYPGRGLIQGRDSSGEHAVQAYWLEGRSPNSRNRRFCLDGDRLYTDLVDRSQVSNTSLTLYDAMRAKGSCFVVSNGDQTFPVLEDLTKGLSFGEAQEAHTFEPDEPNFTPRITGACELDHGYQFAIGVLRRDPWGVRQQLSFLYDTIHPGYGYGVWTYDHDVGEKDRLPSWEGEPVLLPFVGDIDFVLRSYWAALDGENRVALAVRFINEATRQTETRIINKYGN